MTSEQYLQLGFVYIEEKMWLQAADCLTNAEKAFEREQKAPALLNSYLGLSIAMSGGDLAEALRRARSGLDKASYRPEFYLNLGRVYLKAKDKEKAVQTFCLGLQLDDRHTGLTKELRRLQKSKRAAFKVSPAEKLLKQVSRKDSATPDRQMMRSGKLICINCDWSSFPDPKGQCYKTGGLVCVLLSLNVGKFDRCLLESPGGKAKLLGLGKNPKTFLKKRDCS